MEQIINQFLNSFLPESTVRSLLSPCTFLAIAIMAWFVYVLCRRLLMPLVVAITRRTSTDWDDDLLNKKVLRAFSQLAPALLVAALLPDTFTNGSSSQNWIIKGTELYILWAVIHLINTFLQSLFDALDRRNSGKINTLRGVLQMVKLFFIIIGVIVGISILIGKSPIAIIAALGASAAVLMLIFQDTILGLVAGVQLTVNEMLKKGDWIVVPKANANGEVIEISLTTVKIQNWDMSVTTIPPYTLIKESFQNYNPMQEGGGRRVCRSIYVDFSTVRFLSPKELNELDDKGFLKGLHIDSERPQVNLEILSRHLEQYLSENVHVNNDMLIMVRQLQPTPQGLPLELYFFTNDTRWKNYEHIQASIFDYVYATIREFNLSIYQAPAGNDFKQISKTDVLN